MFGRKHQGRRSTNIVFVIFRLMLSLVMFGLLLGGVYSAYKHFSGFDPLKLDPQAIVSNLIQAKTPQQFIQATPNSAYEFRFVLMADSHNDSVNLKKAIAQVKQNYPDSQFIIGLGDYTEVGTLDELKKAKNEFDLSTLRYFLTSGDHDLWDSRDKQTDPPTNFKEIFGPLYQAFTFNGFRFIILYNSDNYLGLGHEQINWLTDELEKAKQEARGIFVFIHEPLYHPSSDHFMGRVEKQLQQQAESLIYQLKEAGVKKVFAGDVHYFSEYSEPKINLSMVTIGAITIERNPQSPRFAVVYVFEDGTTKVEDVEIK